MYILDPVSKVLTLCCVKYFSALGSILENVSLTYNMIFFIDVDSLFMNVPLRETVDYLGNFIFSSNISRPIPVDFLRELFILRTHKIRFHFKGTTHGQIDGFALGNL